MYIFFFHPRHDLFVINFIFFVQDDQLTAEKNSARLSTGPPDSIESRQSTIRKNSLSLLDPDATAIPSLLDLTQQDFEVNAPVNSLLLQGTDLLTALDISGPI
jgi:hypothetical protein